MRTRAEDCELEWLRFLGTEPGDTLGMVDLSEEVMRWQPVQIQDAIGQ